MKELVNLFWKAIGAALLFFTAIGEPINITIGLGLFFVGLSVAVAADTICTAINESRK